MLMYDNSRKLLQLGIGEQALQCRTARLQLTVDEVAGVALAQTFIRSKEEKEVVQLLGLLRVTAKGLLAAT